MVPGCRDDPHSPNPGPVGTWTHIVSPVQWKRATVEDGQEGREEDELTGSEGRLREMEESSITLIQPIFMPGTALVWCMHRPM